MIKHTLTVLVALLIADAILARDIVVGVEKRRSKKLGVIISPLVVPDVLGAKLSVEYSVHPKINIILPVEAKWMDYPWAIKLFAKMYEVKTDMPESFYKDDAKIKPLWNIDFSHFKISSGLGLKLMPFSESFSNGFFVKTSFLAGYERFNAYHREGVKKDAVITHMASIGYMWAQSNFLIGFELGEEYTWHTDPIKNLPIFIDGFAPLAAFSLGFAI